MACESSGDGSTFPTPDANPTARPGTSRSRGDDEAHSGGGSPTTVPADADLPGVACLTGDEATDLSSALALEPRLHGYLCPGAWFATQEQWEAMAAPP